jgi:hypothetical protein
LRLRAEEMHHHRLASRLGAREDPFGNRACWRLRNQDNDARLRIVDQGVEPEQH